MNIADIFEQIRGDTTQIAREQLRMLPQMRNLFNRAAGFIHRGYRPPGFRYRTGGGRDRRTVNPPVPYLTSLRSTQHRLLSRPTLPAASSSETSRSIGTLTDALINVGMNNLGL